MEAFALIIKHAEGVELEKEKPNTSEDFFNRSIVTYEDGGNEKELQVLYVRYFDEQAHEFSFFQENEGIEVGNRTISFKDIVALVCLLQNPSLKEKKRIYINNIKDFQKYFVNVEKEKILDIFQEISTKGYWKQ